MKLTLIFAATLLTFVSAACDGPFHEQCKTTCYGDSDCIGSRRSLQPPDTDPATGEVEGRSLSTESSLKVTSIETIVLQDYLGISAARRNTLDVFGEEIHADLHSASRSDSSSEHRLCIKTGYDKALEQRQQLHVGLLNKIAQDIWADADPTFKQISVCHFPQLGYLLNILVMEDASEELPT
ncbi:unnamed protein product [Tilletia controversa]|nr:unnamed protein product [Tilletia controversa]CAD6986416.1 unnamed protein product [Tilletia controversa]CAD7061170.1 unnamed protein product [Tilletia caries]